MRCSTGCEWASGEKSGSGEEWSEVTRVIGGREGGTSDVVDVGGWVSGDETASGVNGEFALASGEGCCCCSPAGDAGLDGPRRWKRKCDSMVKV